MTKRAKRAGCRAQRVTSCSEEYSVGERTDVGSAEAAYPNGASSGVDELDDSSKTSSSSHHRDLLSAALLAKIDVVEAENRQLKNELSARASQHRGFTVEDIAANDDLVKLYTGFASYEVLLAFYEFLGPAVDELNTGERRTTQESANAKEN